MVTKANAYMLVLDKQNPTYNSMLTSFITITPRNITNSAVTWQFSKT